VGLEPSATAGSRLQLRLAPRGAIDEHWQGNRGAERLVAARRADGSLANYN
jgi:hypothetical protein